MTAKQLANRVAGVRLAATKAWDRVAKLEAEVVEARVAAVELSAAGDAADREWAEADENHPHRKAMVEEALAIRRNQGEKI